MTSSDKPYLVPTPSMGALLRPRLSPLKWNTWPVLLQVLLSAGLAMGMIAVLLALAPDTARALMIHIHLAIHEGGHALLSLAQGGQVLDISLRADGSGRVTSTSSDHVLTAGGGLLLPSITAALLITSAATRTCADVICVLVAIPLSWLGLEAGDDPVIRWSLWGWSAFALLVALPGIPHVLQSAGTFVIGAVLTIGIIETIDTLSVEYVTTEAERSLTGLEQIPSDIRIIADAFGQTTIDEARAMILLAMFACGSAAICIIARFLIIHRKR